MPFFKDYTPPKQALSKSPSTKESEDINKSLKAAPESIRASVHSNDDDSDDLESKSRPALGFLLEKARLEKRAQGAAALEHANVLLKEIKSKLKPEVAIEFDKRIRRLVKMGNDEYRQTGTWPEFMYFYIITPRKFKRNSDRLWNDLLVSSSTIKLESSNVSHTSSTSTKVDRDPEVEVNTQAPSVATDSDVDTGFLNTFTRSVAGTDCDVDDDEVALTPKQAHFPRAHCDTDLDGDPQQLRLVEKTVRMISAVFSVRKEVGVRSAGSSSHSSDTEVSPAAQTSERNEIDTSDLNMGLAYTSDEQFYTVDDGSTTSLADTSQYDYVPLPFPLRNLISNYPLSPTEHDGDLSD